MTDPEFLSWLADRLVHRYGESPNVDFVLKLRKLAADFDFIQNDLLRLSTKTDRVLKVVTDLLVELKVMEAEEDQQAHAAP